MSRRRGWQRVALWVVGIIVALVVVAGVTVVILLHSQRFHRYLLRTAEAKVTSSLGSQVGIGNFQIHWNGLAPSLDIYNLVVAGAPPYATPPLLRVDRVELGIQITSLWHRTWYLSRVVAVHPVVWFYQDAEGRTNLPTFGGGGGGGNIFDLAIRQARIEHGEVYANARRSALEAQLRGVRFQASYSTLARRYTGSLGYDDGHLQYQNFQPIPHALAVNFTATPAELDISDLELSSGNTHLHAVALWKNYAHPQIAASFELGLDATQARAIFYAPQLPAGMVTVQGTAHYQAPPEASGPLTAAAVLEAVSAEGNFSSPQLATTVAGLRTPVRAAQGHYQLAHGNLDVRGVRAQLLGGEARAQLQIRDLAGQAAARLEAQLSGAQLGELARYTGGGPTLGQAGITGQVDATAQVAWQGAGDNLSAELGAKLRAALAPEGTNGSPIPLQGQVEARYAGNELTLRDTSLSTPKTTVSASGTVGTAARGAAAIDVRLQSQQLHELETIADRVALALANKALPPLELYGVGSFAGTVSGTLAAPQIAGQVAAADLKARGTTWRTASAAVRASPRQIQIAQGSLAGAAGEQVQFSLQAGLRQWSFEKSSPIQASLQAQQIAVAPLAKLLGQSVPVSGLLSAKLELQGSLLRPEGQGSATLSQAKFQQGAISEPLQAATATFSGTGSAVQVKATVTLAAGVIRAAGTYDPQAESYQAELHADGIRVDRLHTVEARNLRVLGTVSLDGSGQGTLANPGFSAKLSSPKLEVQGQPVTQLAAQAELANHRATGSVNLHVAQTVAHGQGAVTLSGDYPATATLDTQVIPIAPLVDAYASTLAGEVSGQTEVHATLHGPLRHIDQVQAAVTLPVLRLNYGDVVKLAAAQPLRFTLAGGLVTLQPAVIEGTNTHLALQGTIPVTGGGTMHLVANGAVDLKVVEALDDSLTTAGALQINLTAGGTFAAPNLAGDIRIVNASLASDALPTGLQNANGELTLAGNRLNIAKLTATVGGGTLTGSGGVVFGVGDAGVQFNLGLAARQVRLLYPPNVRDEFGANLSLTGNTEAAYLTGRVQIENVSVTPQFDLASFAGQITGGGVVVAAPGSFTQNLNLNIAVTTPNQINTVSRDFSLQANANLTVRGTAADPVILGRVNLNSGDLIFRGNRYVIQSGTLDFVNPTMTQPVVNITADTTIQQYNLHLHFQGPSNNLQTAYTSDPALPPADIINLLAFGQTNEASAANPTPGNLGAENLIASAVSGQITDRVQKIAGISQLSVDPVLGGNQQNAGARIAVQQRVTGNLFVTISTDVTSTQRDVIEIQYKLTPKVSVSAVRDQNGGIGLNARFKKVW